MNLIAEAMLASPIPPHARPQEAAGPLEWLCLDIETVAGRRGAVLFATGSGGGGQSADGDSTADAGGLAGEVLAAAAPCGWRWLERRWPGRLPGRRAWVGSEILNVKREA